MLNVEHATLKHKYAAKTPRNVSAAYVCDCFWWRLCKKSAFHKWPLVATCKSCCETIMQSDALEILLYQSREALLKTQN